MKIPNPCSYCTSFCREFKEFALKGNVLDLAVGIVIGTAFSDVVQSLVDDIITPPFGLLLGGVDFANLAIEMKNFVYTDKPPVVIRYGKFIQVILTLLLMALVLFFIIKGINKLHEIATRKRLEEESQVKIELSDEGKILLEIRDILAKRVNVVVHEFVL